MNRIEIARSYAEELLRQRSDIVAAWVDGSVARGEETAFSDIDLRLMVAGENTNTTGRAGLDGWRDGVYVEAGLVSQQDYLDLEAVLNDPFRATFVNDALILYDPSGFVMQLQNAVRPVFMQPKWLGKRLAFWLENTRTALAQFLEAVTAADPLRICAALGWFTFGCASIPLLHAGITPSSTRSLVLLGPIAPTLKAQLIELEGSTQMSPADVLALGSLFQEAMPFVDASFGQLPVYFTQKTQWMAQQGQHQEALHAMWLLMSAAAEGCRQRNDLAVGRAGTALVQRWLDQTGMHEAAVLTAKVRSAEVLLGQVEAFASMS